MAQFYSAKRRVTTRQIITVTVNDSDPSGQDVACYQGKALFVSGVSPQEQAEVVLTEDEKQYARAQVRRRLTGSPQRQTPRCPHFGICGDCQQQHVSVMFQQQSKRAAPARLMKCEVDGAIAGASWGYCRRVCLSLSYQPKAQQLQMGFRQANAKAIVDVAQCPVLVPQLEALLPAVCECLSALSASRHLGHAELVQADNDPLMVLCHTAAPSASDREKLERFSQTYGLSLYLTPQNEILEYIHDEVPWYTSGGLRLVLGPRDSIQANDGVNQQIVRTALEWPDLQPGDRVLDLSCGVGNFILLLAARAAHVVGVEGVPALVGKGQGNIALNGLSNATFFHENLEEDITRQVWVKYGLDRALLDPACAGAPGVTPHIVKPAPRWVVYVSCNPVTLARDGETSLQAGYQTQRLAMLDMFSHTSHLELMVLFERRLT